MSRKSTGENRVSQIWHRFKKESSAIGLGGPRLRVILLVILVFLIFLCLLVFPPSLLPFDTDLLVKVQNVRLTLNPYTPTATVTPTKKPTHTFTPTVTQTPTGTQPTPTITPTFLTPTFTVTSTPTKPTVPLQILRPDSEYAWRERITDSWLWRHLYAMFVGVLLAGWLVVLYIRDVYRINRSVRSIGLLMRMLFWLPVGTIRFSGGSLVDAEGRIVRNDWVLITPEGKIVYKNDQPVKANAIRRVFRLLRVGVPARLIVDPDSCVVVEGRQKQSLVIGPTGDKGLLLLGFSRVRRGVNLRDTAVKINVQQLTNDGVPLSAEDFQITFSVFRGGRSIQGNYYPYVDESIFNLVYRYWLEGEWQHEMTARITAELRQFITARPLNIFLPHLAQNQVSPVVQNNKADPFNEFVNEFNILAHDHGVQIEWSGEGKWKLPAETDITEQLQDWQMHLEELMKLPEQFSSEPVGREDNQDLINLIRQIPLSLLEPLMSSDLSSQAMLTIVEAYRDKINEALDLYQRRGQIPPNELVSAIDYLNRLILRRIGGA